MPDLSQVLAAHAAHLRLLGRSPRTIYDRERAVIRLARWLPTGCQVLDATAADLANWRAGLAVSDRAVVGYCGHVREFYAWAITQGLIAVNPAEGLPLPSLPRRIPRPVSEEDLHAAPAAADARARPRLGAPGW